MTRRLTGHATAAFVCQAASSATNFGALVLAAHCLGTEDFGWFAALYSYYLLVLGSVQALTAQRLVVAKEGVAGLAQQLHRSAALVGLAAGIPLLLAAGLTDRPGLLLVVGAALPVLMAHELLRAAASVAGRTWWAALSDLLWLAVVLGGAVLLLADGQEGARGGVLGPAAVWCLGGVAAYVLLLAALFGARGERRGGVRLDGLSRRFFLEYALTQGVSQLSMLALGVVAAVTAIGGLRGAISLFGPVGMVISAVPILLVPVLRAFGPRRRASWAAALGARLVTGVAALLALLLLAPWPGGEWLLADTWSVAEALVLPIGVQFAAMAVGALGLALLRITEPLSTLPIRLVGSAVFVACFWCGYVIGGVEWAAWGLAAGSAVQAALAWRRVLGGREIAEERQVEESDR